MKISILGAGSVGATLGMGWAQRGHEIMFGSRTPENLASIVAKAGTNARAGTYPEAIAFGDVLVLAVPWAAVRTLIESNTGWHGKILIDATNRLRQSADPDSVGASTQDIAHWAKGARVVKAFNTIGYETMENPVFGPDHAALLLCGDDASANAITAGLASELGFEPVDVGGLALSDVVDHMTRLWVGLAMRSKLGRGFAFKLLKRG